MPELRKKERWSVGNHEYMVRNEWGNRLIDFAECEQMYMVCHKRKMNDFRKNDLLEIKREATKTLQSSFFLRNAGARFFSRRWMHTGSDRQEWFFWSTLSLFIWWLPKFRNYGCLVSCSSYGTRKTPVMSRWDCLATGAVMPHCVSLRKPEQ